MSFSKSTKNMQNQRKLWKSTKNFEKSLKTPDFHRFPQNFQKKSWKPTVSIYFQAPNIRSNPMRGTRQKMRKTLYPHPCLLASRPSGQPENHWCGLWDSDFCSDTSASKMGSDNASDDGSDVSSDRWGVVQGRRVTKTGRAVRIFRNLTKIFIFAGSDGL